MESSKVYEFIMPQMQVKYSLTQNTNFRAAATYTYSRPNFEDVLPYKQEDIDEVQYGNPQLEFPRALNIDLLGETYLKSGGLISGGLFYKKIEDFVFYYKRFVHLDESFSTAGLKEVSMAQNGIKAFVYGAEINNNVKFSFLPSFLGNFGIYMNYTYTYSEAYINKRVETKDLDEVFVYGTDGGGFYLETEEEEMIPLPGQARHTANVALFYDAKRLYAKISSNFHDAFLLELGQEPDFDLYYDRAFHLDFSADYMLGEHFNIFLDMINLTNAPLRMYMGDPGRTKQQEYYSFWGRIGFRYKL
jgi:TonB-dependent receptor